MKKKILLALAVCSLLFTVSAVTVFAAGSQKTAKRTNYHIDPEITIDYEQYSESNVPVAICGEPYKIFTASAQDVYGNDLPVISKVYIHYLESTKSLVNLEDGYALPSHYGIYTVEYSARDEFGNVGTATYDFTCDNVERLSVSVIGGNKSVKAGYGTVINDFEYSNAIGDVYVEIIATFINNNSIIEYYLSENSTFVPLYVGTYEITYVCTDYNLTATDSYTLTVQPNNGAVIYEDPAFPEFYIVGVPYTLPAATCYQFTTGAPVPVEPSISVRYGTDKAVAVTGNTFTATKSGNVTFIYTVDGDEKEYTVKAVGAGLAPSVFDIRSYFYSDNAIISGTSSNLTASTETEGALVKFINPLDSHSFEFVFSIPKAYNNFNKLNFFIKSCNNADNSLKITFTKVSDKLSYISVNDGETFKCDETFFDAATISLRYVKGVLYFGEKFNLDISSVVNFNDENIYFSFGFEELTGTAGVNIYKIDNHSFYLVQGDGYEPYINFETYSHGVETIGNIVTVDRIYVCDVLDPYVEVTYSIVTPSGEFVTDVNGVVLSPENARYYNDYQFVVQEIGYYIVTFEVSDSSGNSEMYAYSIQSADIVAPKVRTLWDLKDTLSVGEAFVVSELVISDGISKNYTVYSYVIKPNMNTIDVEINSAYAFKDAGTYVLCYVVFDESGNSAILTHTFYVE